MKKRALEFANYMTVAGVFFVLGSDSANLLGVQNQENLCQKLTKEGELDDLTEELQVAYNPA